MWDKVKLRELVTIRNGKDHKELQKGQFPVYGSGGIMRYADKYLYDRESVLLPRKGTLNNIQFAKTPFWTVDTCYYTEVRSEKVLPYFLYCALSQFDIQSLNTGSTIPSMTFEKYYNLTIPLPPLATQKRIAGVLGAYDELIENNKRQIKLLEEAAQRLYKHWFVDFKFPGVESTTFVDGVPEGWRRGVLGDIAKFKKGKTITKKKAVKGDVPVIAGGLEPAYYHNQSNTDNPVITVSASGNAGFTRMYHKKVWASDCSYVDKSMTEFLGFTFNSILTLSNGFQYCHQRYTAQAHVTPKDINSLSILIPSRSILEAYEQLTSNLISKQGLLECNCSLAKEARDRLLPKVMEGMVQV